MSKSSPPRDAVLESLADQFEHSNAEAEEEQLPTFFVETRIWKNLLRGKVDVVKGAKGTGKTTLYALLLRHAPELLDTRHVLVLATERPLGATAFRAALDRSRATGGELTRREFRELWERYFVALIVARLRQAAESAPHVKVQLNQLPLYKALDRALVKANLLPRRGAPIALVAMLDSVVSSVKMGAQIGIPPLVLTVGERGRQAPGSNSSAATPSPAHPTGLFEAANTILGTVGISAWIAVDRLDDAFENLSPVLETFALQALLQTYRDLNEYKHIKLKLFMRSDVYRRVVRQPDPVRGMDPHEVGDDDDQGVMGLDKIEADADLMWTSGSLLTILMRRVLADAAVRELYGLAAADVARARDDYDEQEALFARMFPGDVQGQATWRWVQAHLADGYGQVAPRDLIKFMHFAIQWQLEPHKSPDDTKLFDEDSLVEAYREASENHYEKAFLPEYPDLRPYSEALKDKITGFSLGTLRAIWRGLPRHQNLPLDLALQRATELVETGFFSKAPNPDLHYRIAPLFRPALRAVEGDSTLTPDDKRLLGQR